MELRVARAELAAERKRKGRRTTIHHDETTHRALPRVPPIAAPLSALRPTGRLRGHYDGPDGTNDAYVFPMQDT